MQPIANDETADGLTIASSFLPWIKRYSKKSWIIFLLFWLGADIVKFASSYDCVEVDQLNG